MLLPEALLNRMQFAILRQPLNCGDFCAIQLYCEGGAAFQALAVDYHGAGPALAGIAPDVRAGQAEVIPQKVNQQSTRLNVALIGHAVYFEFNRSFHVSTPLFGGASFSTQPCAEEQRRLFE